MENTRKDQVEETAKELAKIFIDSLKEEQLPWSSGFSRAALFPYNPVSGTRYQGGSRLLLMQAMIKNNYDDPRFMTFNHAKALGAHVKKGEHGYTCIRYQPYEKTVLDKEGNPILDKEGNEQKETYIIPCPYKVFNVQQIEGLKLKPLNFETHDWDPIERAEKLIKESGAVIDHSKLNTTPCYIPMLDEIRMPEKEQFKDAGKYYSTLLHEMSHWTGHESRLDRKLANSFGTPDYAREELRAEIGSALLCAELNIDHEIDNNKAYIQNWCQLLEDQPKEILYAASAADKISGYLLQFDKFKEKEVLEKIDTKKNSPKSKLSEKQFNEFKKQAIDSLAKQGLMKALEKPRKHETVRTTPDKNGEYDVVANGKVVMHHKADKNSNSHERELER